MTSKDLKGQTDLTDNDEWDGNTEPSKIKLIYTIYEDSIRNTKNTVCFHWKDQPVNVVWRINRYLLL
jgi:hypothetical protein